jgi:hypothetical protein
MVNATNKNTNLFISFLLVFLNREARQGREVSKDFLGALCALCG